MKKLFTLTFTLFAFYCQAQMVGTSVFLQGNYVEVGTGHNGYYGSDTAAPSGYHPHATGSVPSAIGFVADPLATGWSTATGSHYMGDYFLPGFPFEGWDLQIHGNRCQAYNNGPTSGFIYAGGVTCTAVSQSYSSSGSTVTGTWQGTVDSVIINQQTTLNFSDMFFITQITLTNTAVLPKDSIYYFRSLDPDNDETWPGGGFGTHNVIEHQMPGDSSSVVSATGYSSTSAYMALGTSDTNSRAIIYNAWPITVSQNLDAVYNGTYTGSGAYYGPVGTDHAGDIAIGLIVFVPHLATVDSAADSVLRTTSSTPRHPANQARFTFFYSFSPAATDSALAHTKYTASSGGSLGVQNANIGTEVKVYPNPAKDMVYITGLHAGDQISMYDMMGKNIIAGQQIVNQGINSLSLSSVSSGMYLLVVTDASGNVTNRLPVNKR